MELDAFLLEDEISFSGSLGGSTNSSQLAFDESDSPSSTEPWESLVDRSFVSLDDISDKYVVSDVILGSGTFAIVYLGRAIEDGERVAVKRINKQLLFSDEERSAVDKEVGTLWAMDHPNVIRVFDVAETRRFVYLVTELCDGPTLKQHVASLKGGVASEALAQRVIRQVLEGLQYLHRLDLVHGDIKASNILLCDVGGDATEHLTVKLIDLGFASDDDDDRQSRCASGSGPNGTTNNSHSLQHGAAVGSGLQRPYSQPHVTRGTSGLLAPELLCGLPASSGSDLWAAGIVLYSMLFGGVPSNPTAPGGVRIPSAFGISEEAQQVLSYLLTVEPSRRPSADYVLQSRWFTSNV